MQQASRTPRGQFRKGSSGNTAGRPVGVRTQLQNLKDTFATTHAQGLLDLCLGHAYASPSVAMWLLARVLGLDNWVPETGPDLGPLLTPTDCDRETEKLYRNHAAGSLATTELRSAIAFIEARRSSLAKVAEAPHC